MLPAALVVALLGAGRAVGEEIRLRDGEILHGTILRRDEARVEVAVDGRTRRLAPAEIAEITAGAPPAGGYGLPQRWGAARRRARTAAGGTAATDAAARRALDWLAAHQEADGRLDADGFARHDPAEAPCDGAGGGHHGERVPCPFDGAATGAALLAWLASGSTPVSGPYREPIARALAWCRGVLDAGPRGAYDLWNYGFCAQAVADAYWMLRIPEDRPRLQAAIRRILALQRDDGGWSYYLGIGDVPTTAVAAGALALCRRAGLEVPASSRAATLRFLDARVDDASGRSEYHDGAERKGYTPTRANAAAALGVRALYGALDQAPGRARQLAAIRDKPVWRLELKELEVNGRTVRAQVGNLYPYLWYHATVALHEAGGTAWRAWFGALKKALAEGQRREGSCAGSFDPRGSYSSSAGRVFVTALCALMLQAPTRYPRAP